MDDTTQIDPEPDADVPFGGCKQRGVGRQNGIAGFEQYFETKSPAWPSA